MKYALGIDIGGTSIKGAIVDDEGNVLTEPFSLPINPSFNQNQTIDALVKCVGSYLVDYKQYKIDGIGLGIPGTIDTDAGVVSFSNNLKWEELPIVKMFNDALPYRVEITNDANAAALGEAKFGAGRQYKNMIMITLGTGVGSGIILDGKIFEGNKGKGAEIGHTTLVYNGIPCTCGRKGCFEMYASATALINQTKEAMAKNPASLLYQVAEKEGKVNGRVAFEAEKLGDNVAADVVKQYIAYLSEGLLNICNVFRPEIIVLSGGIANQGANLTDRVNKYLDDNGYGYPRTPKVIVKKSEVGYNSGIIGAASLIF